MRKGMAAVMLAAAAAAVAAGAQTPVGNPPGNTLAPEAGAAAPPSAVAAPPAVAAAPAVAAKTPAQLAADKAKTDIVCKTTVETGSLIAKHKTCLTRKQWEYVNNSNEDFARKMMMDNMGHPPSN